MTIDHRYMKKTLADNFKSTILLAIVIVVALVWYFFSSPAPKLGAYVVSQGDIVSSYNVPGTVSSNNSVDLAFQEPGQISKVYVKEGEAVTAGEALASLDDSAQQATLSQEKAVLAAADEKLNELEEGARPEELALYGQQYDSAAAALIVAMNNAYLKTQDAIVNNIDALFTNGSTVNPILNVPDQSQSDARDIENERIALGDALAAWNNALALAATATSSLDAARLATSNDIAQAQAFLTHLDAIVGDLNTGNSGLSQTQIDADTTIVNAANQEVTAAANAETSAAAAWSSARDALALEQAGSQSQDIEAQKDVVLQAQAEIDAAQLAISNATIVAPFSGTVRNVNAKSGMVVSINAPVMSIINNQIMKFDAYASQMEIPTIEADATTTVTLDAYGDGTMFPAEVDAIDTSDTSVNGAPAYHVTLYFTALDPRVLSGMTGDMHVVGTKRANAIEIPYRLVLGSDADRFVLAYQDGALIHRPVSIGIVGNDGMVEILSGLRAGDIISDF
jgi:HlyD family secretion protein